MSIVSLLVGIIVGYIVYLLVGIIAPTPFPVIAGLLAFVVVAFGDRFGVNTPWR